MKILGWGDMKSGTFHFRIREPLRGLEKLGHEVIKTNDIGGRHLNTFEILLVRALHDPLNSRIWQRLKGSHVLVYDLDDDLWAWNPSTPAYRYWNEERLAQAEKNIMLADLVTTPSKRLAYYLSQLNPNVEVLPNTIPHRLLTLLPERQRTYHQPFVVGWQGAHQHIGDLQIIYNPLFRFMLKHRDVELRLWGPERFEDLPKGLAERVRCYGWEPSIYRHYYRLDMDIALAPLDMTDPFNETKSDLRVREAGALGIPVIASAGITYDDSVVPGYTGFLTRDESDWEDCLETLYRFGNERNKIGYQARVKAKEWTTEKNAHLWENAYGHASTRAARASTRAAAAAFTRTVTATDSTDPIASPGAFKSG